MVEKINEIPEGATSFEASGVKFLIHNDLTADGYEMLEKLRAEAETGAEVGQLLKQWVKTYELLNQGKFADASVSAYNSISGMERIKEGRPAPWLLILSLFVRPEGSDLSKWKEEQAAEWVKKWNEGGFGVNQLFKLASAVNERFSAA